MNVGRIALGAGAVGAGAAAQFGFEKAAGQEKVTPLSFLPAFGLAIPVGVESAYASSGYGSKRFVAAAGAMVGSLAFIGASGLINGFSDT